MITKDDRSTEAWCPPLAGVQGVDLLNRIVAAQECDARKA